MPEAVIVATARSPIGRANKGSLVTMRPDDMSVQIVEALMKKVPQVQGVRRRRPDDGHRPAGRRGRASTSPASSPCSPASTTSPASPSTATARRACRPSAWPYHAIKAGEGDCFIAAGVETVSRYASGASDTAPNADLQAVGRAHQAARPGRPGPMDAADRFARHVHRHGPDRRERGRVRRRDPRGDGSIRRAFAEPGVRVRRERLLRSGDHTADRSTTARSSARTTARVRAPTTRPSAS